MHRSRSTHECVRAEIYKTKAPMPNFHTQTQSKSSTFFSQENQNTEGNQPV